jgi:hypothetical protein
MGRHRQRRGWKGWLFAVVLTVLLIAEVALCFVLAVVAVDMARVL